MNYFHEVRHFKLKCAMECRKKQKLLFWKTDHECQRQCVEHYIESLLHADNIRHKDIPDLGITGHPSDR